MIPVSPALDPQWLDETRLTVCIDGRRFGAQVEDGLLVVTGVVENGRQIPVPRWPDFAVRFTASAHGVLTGEAHQF